MTLTVLLYKLSLKHHNRGLLPFFFFFYSLLCYSPSSFSLKKKGKEICSLSHFYRNSLYIPFVKLLQLYTIYHTNPHLHYSSLHKEIVFLTFYLGPYLSKRQPLLVNFSVVKSQDNQTSLLLSSTHKVTPPKYFHR